MPEIEIRSAIATDIPYLVEINHDYTSERVWQMEILKKDKRIDVFFREVSLPRSVRVSYPVNPGTLPDTWTQRSVILLAMIDSLPVGYLGLMENITPQSVWISDFAIAPKYRRQGIGSALLIGAKDWVRARRGKRIVFPLQPKNYPAICLARKMGFEFYGYRDMHFENRDIAIFFEKWI